MARTLLLVDDELPVLRALQRLFRPAGYQILTAQSGAEALALMAQQPVHVVLSDFRMPQMTGDKLLREVKELYPGTVRMILSGFADLNAVMSALNDGAVYKFLVKPWDNEELKDQIEEAFRYWATLQRELAASRLMDSSHERFFDLDGSGTVIQLTPLAAQLCGVDASRATGCQLTELLPGLDDAQLQQILESPTCELTLAGDSALTLRCNRHESGHFTVLVVEQDQAQSWALGLTGLYERQHGLQNLQQEVDAGRTLAVICLNLERYDSFRESLSFSDFDLLLQQVARQLMALSACEQLILMGDGEFLMVVDSLTEQQTHTIIEHSLAAFEKPIQFSGREAYLTFYGGYALAPEDESEAEVLAQKANTAARHARNRGRFFYPRYRSGMQRGCADHLELQNDLYRALERNELYVEYQPKLDAFSGRVLGAEALLRWQHHQRGKISPAVFIPLAEANGLIEPIGEWVLCTAVTQARFWQQEGMAKFTIAVNLSGRQLRQREKLVEQVSDILKQSGMPPRNLELEVTETFLMEDIEESLALLAELKQLGIKLAIDDFGTGYSSLAYLDRMPADTLKLDLSFIRKLPHEKDTVAMVRQMIEMAHSLGMQVVAEGVENRDQLAMLQEMGCDELQGFLFSPPVSAGDFRTLLARQPLNVAAEETTPAPA